MPQNRANAQRSPSHSSLDSATDPLAQSPTDAAGSVGSLAIDLAGPLPCVGCKYDLRGLSITASCPECDTPVRATLVRVLAPDSQEAAALRAPAFVSWSLVAWAACGALSAACVLALHALAWMGLLASPLWTLLGMLGVASCALNAACVLAMFRPFRAKDTTLSDVMLGVACLACVPACIALYVLVVERQGWTYTRDWWLQIRSLMGVCVVLMLLCVRPTLRMLASRAWVREQRPKDRQTTFSLALVVGLGVVALLGIAASPLASDAILASMLSHTIVLLVLLLLTLGLSRLALELLHMRPLIETGLAKPQQLIPRPTKDTT
jgi:hypothetical protein